MSQPRRRRRRRKGASRPPEGQTKKHQKGSQPQRERAHEGASSRRRKRKGRSGQRKRTSPASSEDLVRAPKKPAPATLTGPHDGTTLEQVIGELQSTWGVPQHPQEYRLVLKVPEEKNGDRATALTATEEAVDPPDEQTDADKPRREKAPAAPRIGSSGEAKSTAPARRRRGRRRRKRSKGGGSGS
jgi:hypothetical protein